MNKRSGEETRRNILNVALQIFTEQGYDSATMRSIAQAAGISVGGLYLYFRNKSDLYLTILKEWLDTIQNNTLAALARAVDPNEELTAYITTTINFTKQNRQMFLLMGNEMGCARGMALKRQYFHARRELLADIVRRGSAAMLFRKCNPDETARIIFNVLRGFIMSLLIDEEGLFDAETCIDLILNGLARRNDG